MTTTARSLTETSAPGAPSRPSDHTDYPQAVPVCESFADGLAFPLERPVSRANKREGANSARRTMIKEGFATLIGFLCLVSESLAN